nr:hypothetical protein CFP56_00740 [Quercus suber]
MSPGFTSRSSRLPIALVILPGIPPSWPRSSGSGVKAWLTATAATDAMSGLGAMRSDATIGDGQLSQRITGRLNLPRDGGSRPAFDVQCTTDRAADGYSYGILEEGAGMHDSADIGVPAWILSTMGRMHHAEDRARYCGPPELSMVCFLPSDVRQRAKQRPRTLFIVAVTPEVASGKASVPCSAHNRKYRPCDTYNSFLFPNSTRSLFILCSLLILVTLRQNVCLTWKWRFIVGHGVVDE